MYFESLEAVIKVLTAIRIFKISRKKDRARIYNAVEAIRSAANRTMYYYARMRTVDEEPNLELSESWLEAARAVRELDIDLYQRLLNKADFWANPSNWTQEMSEQHNIYLETILEDSDRILNV